MRRGRVPDAVLLLPVRSKVEAQGEEKLEDLLDLGGAERLSIGLRGDWNKAMGWIRGFPWCRATLAWDVAARWPHDPARSDKLETPPGRKSDLRAGLLSLLPPFFPQTAATKETSSLFELRAGRDAQGRVSFIRDVAPLLGYRSDKRWERGKQSDVHMDSDVGSRTKLQNLLRSDGHFNGNRPRTFTFSRDFILVVLAFSLIT